MTNRWPLLFTGFMRLDALEMRLIWSCGNMGFICIARPVPSEAAKFICGF